MQPISSALKHLRQRCAILSPPLCHLQAQKNAGKYRGVSATEMRVGGYGGGGGGGGYGTGGSHSGSGYGSGGGGGGGGYGSSSFGSGQDGAGPSYGRAQSEMSSHRRHGSGQSAPAGEEGQVFNFFCNLS